MYPYLLALPFMWHAVWALATAWFAGKLALDAGHAVAHHYGLVGDDA